MISLGKQTIGATHHDIRLNTDLTKLLDRVLSRLGLQLSGSLHVGHQGEVYEHGVLTTHIVAKLTNCLQKGQAFDVTDSATDLDNDHIDVVFCQALDGCFDFIGDMRDDLNCLPQVVSTTFSFDHRLVDEAGRGVIGLGQFGRREAFVVAQVQIRFRPVIRYENLTVLKGTHRTRIHIDIGIQLLQSDPKTSSLEQASNGSGCQSFTQ